METAVILCEGAFGSTLGKTANGLVRFSRKFKIVGVIDSTHAGMDAGVVLGEKPLGIPVVKDLATMLEIEKPAFLIVGVASIGGMLPKSFRPVIAEAIKNGINVISGLHEFIANDAEFAPLAEKYGVKLIDIRKEPPLDKMHQFMNRTKDIPAIRLPVLGTDSAIGKRTTAIALTLALNDAGIKTTFVTTGQTGLLQGFPGVPLDAIQGDYMVGELEHAIVTAYEQERPKVIVIEGQGSISHPAYVCGTRAILMASQPSGIILQHAPKRTLRNYKREILKLPMPTLEQEMEMLRIFSGANVIAIAINHENMSDEELEKCVNDYETHFGLPVCDVIKHGADKFVKRIKELYGL